MNCLQTNIAIHVYLLTLTYPKIITIFNTPLELVLKKAAIFYFYFFFIQRHLTSGAVCEGAQAWLQRGGGGNIMLKLDHFSQKKQPQTKKTQRPSPSSVSYQEDVPRYTAKKC